MWWPAVCVLVALSIASCSGSEDAAVAPEPDASEGSADVSSPPVDVVEAVDTAEPVEDVTVDGASPPEDLIDDVEDVAEAPEIALDVPIGPQPCDPPLALLPAEATALTYAPIYFAASGGTGAYRFELDENVSGGILNALTGAYLSGPSAGYADVVRVEDLGCVGTATAPVTVVVDMVVSPAAAEVPTGGSLQMAVAGGSGVFSFEIADPAAAGAVDASGLYTAGPSAGQDLLRVTDVLTGQEHVTIVTVAPGAALRPSPPRVYFPAGSSYQLAVIGGSGAFTYLLDGEGFALTDDGLVSADEPGAAVVLVGDAHVLGLATTVEVVAVASQQAPSIRAGDASAASVLVAPGDIDGDGYVDAVLGMAESDIVALNGGAAYVYRGVAGGLEPEPARVFSGPERRDQLGRAVAAADFDGDGRVDLALGVPGAEAGATDAGAVWLYRGVAGAFFEEAPYRILAGNSASDSFGWSLVACDFNDDGWTDLAVGAYLDEDPQQTPVFSNQGAVHVYLGFPGGFGAKPDVTIFGQLPVDGEWAGATELRLGWDVAAGDVDGDGACDLVAGALNFKAGPGRSSDGALFVYRGVLPGPDGPGGVALLPARAWAGLADGDAGSNFGRHVAVGHLDGDEAAEVVAAQYLAEKDGSTADNWGAVRVFRGGVLPSGPATALIAAEAADLTLFGAAKQDQLGWTAIVGDGDGDGDGDLISGNFRHESPIGAKEAGSITVFPGLPPGLPDSTPVRVLGGLAAEDRFGESVALLGDLDGDGAPELVAMAGRGDDIGLDVGRPYLIPGKADAPYVPLEMPGVASGAQIGRGAAVAGDLTGDGLPDLVVGAPNYDPSPQGINSGALWLYPGTAGGFEPEPALAWIGFPGHGGSDLLGWFVAPAGDVDADGVADVAAVARSEDRPKTFDAKLYAAEPECSSVKTDAGGVYVFRGSASGLPATAPAFLFTGPQASQAVDNVSGGFDFDGDGFDDLVMGGASWDRTGANDAGGFAVYRGGPADATGKIVARCAPHLLILGNAASDALGRSVTALGDLDGDGCDEIAVGANAEDLGTGNQGTVRVVYGYGAGCAESLPRATVLASQVANAQAGFSVSGGHDVDGDGLPDLAVGGFALSKGGNTVGAAWLIPGSALKALPPAPLVDGEAPAKVHPFLPASLAGTFRLDGAVAGEQFGRSVALVPGASGDGRAGLAVGAPFAAFPGTPRAGGVRVYRFRLDAGDYGLDPVPVAVFGGETGRPGGLFGEWVSASPHAAGATLVIGAYEASAVGLDEGAAFAIRLTSP